MSWHQNTDWRIRQQCEALCKTLHSQYLSAVFRGICLPTAINVFIKSFFFLITSLRLCYSYQSDAWPRWSPCTVGLPAPTVVKLQQWKRVGCGVWGSLSALWLIPVAGCLVWGIHLDECAHTAFINVIPGQHDHIKPSQTDYCRRITHVNWQISFY